VAATAMMFSEGCHAVCRIFLPKSRQSTLISSFFRFPPIPTYGHTPDDVVITKGNKVEKYNKRQEKIQQEIFLVAQCRNVISNLNLWI